ncbi:hypothetical protein V1264_004642 [Littorina saxatilis]|uniref:Copper transport protein ATOX1 n=1 Tax=Littorina saxatilis TaxID=31220 RepID=A0AAN9B569_9CAEN
MAAKTLEFKMEMTCEGCANTAKKVLGKQESVTSIVTDVSSQTVLVTSPLSSEEVLKILEKTGKPVEYIGEK